MAAHGLNREEKKAIHAEFSHLVNIPAARLRNWRDSEDSRSVGMTQDGEKVTDSSQAESVGHHMGGRILQLRGSKQSELSDQDFADMRKVVGYIHRQSAQRPKGDITDSRWRKSLMNWDHDPK
ncbi:MAG: DUF3140 domain-containing protein [Pseudomonadota bacterium]|nr:DUF3140 domain-containing protein [Pseudomonadota bacterium]